MNDSKSNINYTIQENGKTVKTIMRENLNFSSRLSKSLELSGKISLNGKAVRLNKNVFEGDILSIEFKEEEDDYEAVCIPLDIVYEDSDLLIVNKPPHIVVHPTKSHQNNTIANGVKYYFLRHDIQTKVRLVNRLDMNTSGIVIVAKNPYAQNELSNQMRMSLVDKYYYAIVEGLVEEDEGTVNAPIARLNPEDIIRVVDPSGKECITHFKVEKRLVDKTLVRLRLETGRTHQIRVHMKHIGHPVLGDVLYGKESSIINRQALHCCEMKFSHPRTGKMLEIKVPVPEDMINAMDNENINNAEEK